MQQEHEVTALNRIHSQWLAEGAKIPPRSVLKPIVESYERARTEREKLEKKLSDLKEKERKAATSIVMNCGKGRFVISGRTYQASSRGDAIFLKQYPAPTEL